MSDASAPPTPTSSVPDLPPRAETTHKGQVGRVAIVAGSRGMSGAAVLCGLGALRGGAGLVRICCPHAIQPTVAAGDCCYMTVALADDGDGRIGDGAAAALDYEWADVWAVGPGLGATEATARLVEKVLAHARGVVIIDADGLNALAEFRSSGASPLAAGKAAGRRPATIITPHPGEMARLRAAAGMPELKGDDDETRLRVAHEYAIRSAATVVLKGHRTVICTADRAYINTTGNPGMATGGMGDVLTGMIAALLGQRLDPFDAARLAVHVHGAAADLCARSIGPVGFLARDVAEHIPAALAQVISSPIGFNQ